MHINNKNFLPDISGETVRVEITAFMNSDEFDILMRFILLRKCKVIRISFTQVYTSIPSSHRLDLIIEMDQNTLTDFSLKFL